MELDTLASIENGTFNPEPKDKTLLSDASQFEVEFKTRGIKFSGQVFISIEGIRPFPIDRLNDDIADIVIGYVRDNMEKYVK